MSSSNSINIIKYFDDKNKELKYDLTYTIYEYKKNKFQLHINIDEEGYYPYTDDYFFDSIYMITRRFDIEKNEGIMIIGFVLNNVKTNYTYRRFSTHEDMEILFKFLFDKVLKPDN